MGGLFHEYVVEEALSVLQRRTLHSEHLGAVLQSTSVCMCKACVHIHVLY